MSCFGLKGGVGTASRRVQVAGRPCAVGTLVLANYGRPAQLVMAGHAVAPAVAARLAAVRGTDARATDNGPEKGSIILLVATDAPLDARQLRRLALRTGAGLARTGSVFGHGSGDVALAFTTAYTVPRDAHVAMPSVAMLPDALLDPLFQAVADGIEQAIVHALWQATPVTGFRGHRRAALRELFDDWPALLAAGSARFAA
jgi:D-aminopeptidase